MVELISISPVAQFVLSNDSNDEDVVKDTQDRSFVDVVAHFLFWGF